MNSDSVTALVNALEMLRLDSGTQPLKCGQLHRQLILALEKYELVETEHCTVIDRRLLTSMPHGEVYAYAVVCFNGWGVVSNSCNYNAHTAKDALVEFGGDDCQFATPNAAMQARLDEHEKPPWHWPVPTDADRGREVYFSDTRSWCGPSILRGVIEGEFPFVVGRVAKPSGWRYAVLADPDNPDARPQNDLIHKTKAAGVNDE